MLLTTMNNVGSTTLFNPVILIQAHNFWPCSKHKLLLSTTKWLREIHTIHRRIFCTYNNQLALISVGFENNRFTAVRLSKNFGKCCSIWVTCITSKCAGNPCLQNIHNG